ncbi:sugar phosphate isomerase/epimerase family protein [Cohnella sp. 56]|uniref:sugar phosphate isomerase/epimerase family protein n=1 Tax=Cohnella sp. 56 TaxID=3113722 RepID=UPI0030E7E275
MRRFVYRVEGKGESCLERISLNQITTDRWSLEEAIDGCVRAGIPWIGLWRHKVQEAGLPGIARLIRDSGLKVSSLCRGGMFPAASRQAALRKRDDNRRAVEEAAELGAEVLVLVCGAAADRDIDSARAQVEEGIAELVPYAASHGVKLGIEPLHPMYAAERSVVVTLAQANELARRFPAEQVGVVIDAFHVWWEPELEARIRESAGRIVGFHVSDWLVPLPHMLMGRGMMGDGRIELRRMREAVEAAGYSGPIEVEIFNQAIWDQPGDEVLARIKQRYAEHV